MFLLTWLVDIAMTGMGSSSSVLANTGYSVRIIAPAWFATIVVVLLKDFTDALVEHRTRQVLMARHLRAQQRELGGAPGHGAGALVHILLPLSPA